MRHRVKKKTLNRDTKNRKALLRELSRSLVEHGSIVTVEAKAKEVKRQMDKMLSKAIKGDLSSRRILHRYFGKRDVVNTLVDKIAPQMGDRKSGFTTIETIGIRRGDASKMSRLSFVVDIEGLGSLKASKQQPETSKPRQRVKTRKSAVANEKNMKVKTKASKK